MALAGIDCARMCVRASSLQLAESCLRHAAHGGPPGAGTLARCVLDCPTGYFYNALSPTANFATVTTGGPACEICPAGGTTAGPNRNIRCKQVAACCAGEDASSQGGSNHSLVRLQVPVPDRQLLGQGRRLHHWGPLRLHPLRQRLHHLGGRCHRPYPVR